MRYVGRQRGLKLRLSQGAGYTLLEVLVVIAIMALLTASVVSLSPAGRSATELRNVVQQFSADLHRARALALAGGEPVVVEFGDRSWTVSDGAQRDLPADVTLPFDAEQAPAAARAVRSVTFYPDGSSSGLEVIFQRGNFQQHVRIDWLTGRIAVAE